jgi:hypothetical protein
MIQRHTTRVTLSNLVIKEHFFQAETSWRTWIANTGNTVARITQKQ